MGLPREGAKGEVGPRHMNTGTSKTGQCWRRLVDGDRQAQQAFGPRANASPFRGGGLGLSFSGCNIRVPLVGGCEVCEADLQENVTAKMSSSRARETALARSKTEARKVHVP